MSTQDLSHQAGQTGSSSKPITGNMEWEIKIRLIIQEVLSATIRKLSLLNDKVEHFEKFFFTYTQRMNEMEERGKYNDNAVNRLFDTVLKNKETIEEDLIKLEEKHENLKLEKNQLNQQVKQMNKKISTISRHNETILNQFSNTKKKFLEYSDQMLFLKQDISWKITKYIEQTAQTNTKIQLSNQQIKKQYFNINLLLDKNKQKYDEIIFNKDKQDSLNQAFNEKFQNFKNVLKEKSQFINSLNKKLEDMDTALYSKIRLTEAKLQRRVDDLVETNSRIQESVSQVEEFSEILEELKEDTEKVRRQLLKKFEESDQKHTQRLEKQLMAINTQSLNTSKLLDKKFRQIHQKQQKTLQFFNQKLQYLKIQIQTQISSKATHLFEQKSRKQSGIENSTLQQINQKISKLTLETKKQINKMENIVKEIKLEVKHQVQDMKDVVETKICNTIKAIQESSGSGVNPEFIQSMYDKIDKVYHDTDQRLYKFGKDIMEQDQKIQQVNQIKNQTLTLFQELKKENQQRIIEIDQKMINKAESMGYTLKKIRGDAMINHEFTQKQFKEQRKTIQATSKYISTILKMFPAISECINLVMCLIYDAEYQHAKVFQDNLPHPTKDCIKFQNVVEGVLYQFVEKRKPGYIMYRHKEQKKVDIVKATFSGYIRVWEDLFGNDFKDREEFIPKTFYRNYVQKNGSLSPPDRSPNRQSNENFTQRRQTISQDNLQTPSPQDSQEQLRRNSCTDNLPENLNRSFRNRKVPKFKSKQTIKIVVHEDHTQQK